MCLCVCVFFLILAGTHFVQGHGHVPWQNGAVPMIPSPQSERGLGPSADGVLRFPPPDKDGPARRRGSDSAYSRDAVEPQSVRGSLVASVCGSGSSTVSPEGIFRDSGNIRPALEVTQGGHFFFFFFSLMVGWLICQRWKDPSSLAVCTWRFDVT